MPSKPWQLSPVAAEKAQLCIRAAELRARAVSWKDIAKQLCLASPLEAKRCADVGYGLAPGEDLRMARQRASAELDLIRQGFWRLHDNPGYATTVSGKVIVDPDTREPMEDKAVKVAALNGLRAVNTEYRKMHGTDAPKRTVSVVTDVPLEEIQAAVEETRRQIDEAEAEMLRDQGPDDDPPGGMRALPPGA